MKQSIVFKEWAPDKPDLGADVLITAKNVIPSVNGYRCFKTFTATSATSPAAAVANSFAANSETKGSQYIYVSAGDYYVSANFGAFASRGGSTVGAEGGITQFDNLVIAVGNGHVPWKHTVGSSSNVSTLASSGTAPACSVVGVIGRFVVLGDLLVSTLGSTARSNVIQWSTIDDPTRWPTPNSATATAEQSGEQIMPSLLGAVTGIHGGDQFGVILQVGGVSRATYEGPPTVFRFDVIDQNNGSLFQRGSINVNGLTYFISRNGFCRTNGVQVDRIGLGKVDRFFWDSIDISFAKDLLNCGYDPLNNLIQYTFPANGSQSCNRMMSYSIDTDSWAYSDATVNALITPNKAFQGQETMIGIANGFLGRFEGTAGAAVIETSDAEFNAGGRAWVDGIKPNIESSATAPSIGVRIGFRDDLATAPSYTSTTGPTAATGFADFRVDAKYVRAEFNVLGNFDRFPSMVASVDPSSER